MPVNPLLLTVGGVLLDRLLGEPRRFHPLVGFGKLADKVEASVRMGAPGDPIGNRLLGLCAWLAIVAPFVVMAARLSTPLLDVVLLWLALGARSLTDHARAIAVPLAAGDLPAARQAVGMIVSRDTSKLDETGVARAGGAGAVLFRLANTLDAMWGYKDERRVYFGWAAARIDDVLNFIPARLTALTYALLGDARNAFACWRTQARAWSSPNAGPVMAAGAGALKVSLGGTARYHGHDEVRPTLGSGPAPTTVDIGRAVQLVERGVWCWLVALVLWVVLHA